MMGQYKNGEILNPLLDLSVIQKQPKLHGIQLPTFFEVYLKNFVLRISFLSVILLLFRIIYVTGR